MQEEFESGELRRLVGIKDFYLNKFIEREQFGLKPSVRTGEKWGTRRRFSRGDVLAVALIWWLYEAGLRTPVIQYVLNQILGRRLNSKAIDAARICNEHKNKALVIEREPRTMKQSDAKFPAQRVQFLSQSNAARLIEKSDDASVLVIPVGNLFTNLTKAMNAL